MRRFLALIILAADLVGCSPPGTRVTEQASLPLTLHKLQMSPTWDRLFSSPARGSLSRAYTANVGTNGTRVWLLLFEHKLSMKERPFNMRFERYVGSLGSVTLLIVEPNVVGSRKGWKIIDSVPLGIVSKLHQDYIQLRWLEPDKQKGPLVVVNTLDGVGGGKELIAFPNGWTQQNPTRARYQNWMRWDDSAEYDAKSIDSNGFLCITETYTSYTHSEPEKATQSIKYHFWDGNGWTRQGPQF